MKIIYVNGLYPDILVDEIASNSKGLIQYGPNKLQYTFLEGLSLYFEDLEVITAPLIGSYPQSYKKPFLSSHSFKYKGRNIFSVSIILFPFVSLLSKTIGILFRLIKVVDPRKDNVIVIYSPHMPYVLSSVLIKLFFKRIQICLYINDLPEYMSANSNVFYRIAKQLERSIFNILLKFVDSFIVVTDLLPLRLNIINKPFIRIEGVYIEDISVEHLIENAEWNQSEKCIVLYSGTLDKRYGIDNLLNAFKLIPDSSFELWICGFGDMESAIIEYQELDSRIKFLGQKKHLEVIELQSRANILVNPRLPIGEYTKFSFPIKTLEFLASKKPCVMYRLSGIPTEYFQYFFTPVDFSIESLAAKIVQVSKLDIQELQFRGNNSRKFILDEINIRKKFDQLYNFLVTNIK